MSDVLYTTLDAVSAELMAQRNEPLSAAATAIVQRNILAASRLIDRYKCVEPGGYKTSAQTTSSIRYFSSEVIGVCLTDCFTSATEVAILQGDNSYKVLTLDTEYYIWPYNAAQVGEPYRALISNKIVFPQQLRGVRVTAKWGISESVPHDIERACAIQVARWYMRALNSWQDSNANPLGGLNFAQSLDPDVRLLLDKAFPHGGGLR